MPDGRPRCSGVPLDERVPGFLNLLNETMQICRPRTTLWWKPWELSKGQVVAILGKVKPDHFGLVLNPSTSNEVYPFNERSFKSDLGVKRLVRMAQERNIPVWGEFDHTVYKPLYQIEDFFPRLFYEQMNGWKEMEGVVGVKEYYGFAPSTFSGNAAMLKAWMKSPQASLEKLLGQIAAPYGAKAAPLLIQAWELTKKNRPHLHGASQFFAMLHPTESHCQSHTHNPQPLVVYACRRFQEYLLDCRAYPSGVHRELPVWRR